MYYKGDGMHSSIFGGVLTLTISLFFVIYAIITLKECINRTIFEFNTAELPLTNVNLKEYFNTPLLNPYFSTEYGGSITNCTNIYLSVGGLNGTNLGMFYFQT